MHADIKGANQKHRNEQLNRSIQNFLYGLLATDNDVAAKKSLAVLTELWRRHVWRDARTVNVIGESLHTRTVNVIDEPRHSQTYQLPAVLPLIRPLQLQILS